MRHQDEKQSKATNSLSLFRIKMNVKLEGTQSNAQQNIEQLQNPTMGATINNESTTTEPSSKNLYPVQISLPRKPISSNNKRSRTPSCFLSWINHLSLFRVGNHVVFAMMQCAGACFLSIFNLRFSYILGNRSHRVTYTMLAPFIPNHLIPYMITLNKHSVTKFQARLSHRSLKFDP